MKTVFNQRLLSGVCTQLFEARKPWRSYRFQQRRVHFYDTDMQQHATVL